MPTPLEGIRVLDFGVLYFAPIAGMMLADMGAEVIRVESVEGETMRWGGIPNVQQVGESQGASQVDHYR
ncbi:MAG: CoA transferase, partial [Chloroflexota bacterium]